MEKYYHAYDKRYRQIHSMELQWASDAPSPIIREIMERYGIGTDRDILEIGCGEGRDALWLLKNGYHVLASDVSQEAVRYCREKAPPYRDQFIRLDVCRDDLHHTFDLIYSIAVIHMLVDQDDRDLFLSFVRDHLRPDGFGLILTMGDGEAEVSSDTTRSFEDAPRTHQETGREVLIAATSCRMVSFATFGRELRENGLSVVEKGLTSIPDFPSIMYALVRPDPAFSPGHYGATL